MSLVVSLEPGERVTLIARGHWFAFWPRFILLLLLAGLPAGFALGILGSSGRIQGSTWRLVAASVILWIGFWLARAALLKHRWDNSAWVLTGRRLVAVQSGAPFRLSTTSIELADLLDVSVRVDGLVAKLLDFGDVECRVGSEGASLLLRATAKPRELALRLQQESRRAHVERAGEADTSTEHWRPAAPR